MKICIFTHQYLPRIGGVQVLVQNLIHYLIEEKNFEVILIAPYYEEKEPEPEVQGKLKIYRIFNPDKKLTVLFSIPKLLAILNKEQPRFIHGQDLVLDGSFCLLANILGGWPYLLSTQGELNELKREKVPWTTLIKVPLLKWIMSRANYLITPEPGIYQQLEKRVGYESKYRLIKNGVFITRNQKETNKEDFIRLHELDLEENLYFLFLGRLVYMKGIFETVKAIAKSQNEFRAAKFKLYFSGEGADKDDLLKCCKEEGVQDLVLTSNIILPNDKWLLLRHCRSMVLHSYEENLPISILEAFGLEKNVIGSDIPEIKAMMFDQHVGCVTKLKDVDELSHAFKTFINEPYHESSESFKLAIKDYDLKQMGHELLDLYEDMPKQ